ncbi:MAG: hypothetical protein HYW25_04820 [Candidatus Aenigmarchaeota archaeon]|nr:hypothetical protein [Candidatus Aenigmarchaeota archaeon]
MRKILATLALPLVLAGCGGTQKQDIVRTEYFGNMEVTRYSDRIEIRAPIIVRPLGGEERVSGYTILSDTRPFGRYNPEDKGWFVWTEGTSRETAKVEDELDSKTVEEGMESTVRILRSNGYDYPGE